MVSPKRIKAGLRRAANWLNRLLARYGRASHSCVIVVNDTTGIKLKRILERLPHYLPDVRNAASVGIVQRASLWQILRARTVLEVDEGGIPVRYGGRLDHICHVDFERYWLDGWELCKATQVWSGLPTEGRRSESRVRLRDAVRRIRLGDKDKIYVFGTGPSLAAAASRDFSDGHVIVCNTIVRDRDLWHHLNPDVIVAGDAIYHFGHTAHARRFRADLRERLLESDGRTHFVYPDLFDAIVRRELSDLDHLLIPIPFGEHDDIHVSLCDRFELPTGLGNVLNQLLLPTACTLSNSVWLWGFDGRAPDDTLFWANSSRHSYPELIPELRAEHPAFYSKLTPVGREQTYVQTVHGAALDERLIRAEAQGYRFSMMHFSWTETLNKRRDTPPVALGREFV